MTVQLLLSAHLPALGGWLTEEVVNHVQFFLFHHHEALLFGIFPIDVRRPLNKERVQVIHPEKHVCHRSQHQIHFPGRHKQGLEHLTTVSSLLGKSIVLTGKGPTGKIVSTNVFQIWKIRQKVKAEVHRH